MNSSKKKSLEGIFHVLVHSIKHSFSQESTPAGKGGSALRSSTSESGFIYVIILLGVLMLAILSGIMLSSATNLGSLFTAGRLQQSIKTAKQAMDMIVANGEVTTFDNGVIMTQPDMDMFAPWPDTVPTEPNTAGFPTNRSDKGCVAVKTSPDASDTSIFMVDYPEGYPVCAIVFRAPASQDESFPVIPFDYEDELFIPVHWVDLTDDATQTVDNGSALAVMIVVPDKDGVYQINASGSNGITNNRNSPIDIGNIDKQGPYTLVADFNNFIFTSSAKKIELIQATGDCASADPVTSKSFIDLDNTDGDSFDITCADEADPAFAKAFESVQAGQSGGKKLILDTSTPTSTGLTDAAGDPIDLPYTFKTVNEDDPVTELALVTVTGADSLGACTDNKKLVWDNTVGGGGGVKIPLSGGGNLRGAFKCINDAGGGTSIITQSDNPPGAYSAVREEDSRYYARLLRAGTNITFNESGDVLTISSTGGGAPLAGLYLEDALVGMIGGLPYGALNITSNSGPVYANLNVGDGSINFEEIVARFGGYNESEMTDTGTLAVPGEVLKVVGTGAYTEISINPHEIVKHHIDPNIGGSLSPGSRFHGDPIGALPGGCMQSGSVRFKIVYRDDANDGRGGFACEEDWGGIAAVNSPNLSGGRVQLYGSYDGDTATLNFNSLLGDNGVSVNSPNGDNTITVELDPAVLQALRDVCAAAGNPGSCSSLP